MSKRRSFSAKFKTKVVLEALQERLSLQEIAQKYQIHPNQIRKWKNEFLNNAETVFDKGSQSKKRDLKEEEKLYKKIGQLQVEVDFLKNALS
jgi:transposase